MQYPLAREESDGRLERDIEELRRQRFAEERNRREEERQEQESKRRAEEINERKKGAKKKGGAAGLFFSYDVHGRSIEVQTMHNFPSLAPKCSQTSRTVGKEAVAGEDRVTEVYRQFVASRPELKEELAHMKVSEKGEAARQALALAPGIYDSLVPTTGVTFIEQGKNPKFNAKTLGDKEGKFNKTEYYSIISEASRGMMSTQRMSGSLQNFFPDLLAKPRLSAAGISSVGTGSISSSPYLSAIEQNVPPLMMARMSVSPGQQESLTQRFDKSGSLRRRVESSLGSQTDMSQLLVAKPETSMMTTTGAWHRRHEPLSMVPKPYVPPSFRRSESANRAASVRSGGMEKTAVDRFNIEVVEGTGAFDRRSLGPILRGGKPTSRFIRASVGTEKGKYAVGTPSRRPRERPYLNSTQYRTKLPPPPLGQSLGHGVLKI